MKIRIAGALLVTLSLFVVGTVFHALRAEAAGIIPLRSGTVVAKTDAGAMTYLKAVDEDGNTFWVVTSICTVGEKGKIDVLTGTHYEKIKSVDLDRVIEDVYTAQLLMIGDQEVTGFGAHGLPAGCVLLK